MKPLGGTSAKVLKVSKGYINIYHNMILVTKIFNLMIYWIPQGFNLKGTVCVSYVIAIQSFKAVSWDTHYNNNNNKKYI